MITLPGIPRKPTSREQADLLIQHAAALGEALGVPEQELARSALSLVIVIAEKSKHPDDALAAMLQSVGASK